MKKVSPLASAIASLVFALGGTVSALGATMEYPHFLLDAYNPDGGCWSGMGVRGWWDWPVPVVPEKWLVGPPPKEYTGVTLPTDHWVELKFRGRIVDGSGDDIRLIELGQCGEQALVFLTDGIGQEYLLGRAKALSPGEHAPTNIDFNISGISLPFIPCAIRLVATTMGGGSPGFDIANVRARIDGGCGETACNPHPIDGEENVPPDAILTWSPGYFADKHIIYFGTSLSDVDEDAAPVGDPPQPQDANSFDPCDLELGKTYVWRIDEVDLSGTHDPVTGDVWSFTVADCLVVDNFESYDAIDNPISDAWAVHDGSVFISNDPAHGCTQSMRFHYAFDYERLYYSETTRAFSPPQDWASSDLKVLELFFYGLAGNVGDGQMYVTLSDGDANAVVPYDGDANDERVQEWQPWRIMLDSLAGLNLANMVSISIGMRSTPDDPSSSGSGTVYFDDIRLCISRCFQNDRPAADFSGNCAVGYEDLDEMAYSWLDRAHNVYPIAAPNAPLAWYKFDEDCNDSSGNDYHGELFGEPNYAEGVYGQAIRFDGNNTCVKVIGAADLFAKISTAVTIAFWQNGADSPHHTDTLCCSNYTYGVDNPAIAINLGCWRQPGKYRWDCGYPWSFGNRLGGDHRYKSEWSGRWNHWAFTKDADTGIMQVFLNGALYDSRTDANSPISGITLFEIGSGWYGAYDGLIDDFRIYDYALAHPEVAYIATNGTGIFDQPLMSPADLYTDDLINFKDFAILADGWLDQRLWP